MIYAYTIKLLKSFISPFKSVVAKRTTAGRGESQPTNALGGGKLGNELPGYHLALAAAVQSCTSVA